MSDPFVPSNPWLAIPLEDYEGHMGPAGVRQLTTLAELFRCALEHPPPESVAILGVAGGNGLEEIDQAITKKIVGVDINQRYLDEVRQRFDTLPGLELHCRDLANPDFRLAPVALVHAALIFEHAGLGVSLTNALSLVAPGGRLSVVLQRPSAAEPGVASTNYASMQTLKKDFALIDPGEFQRILERQGFQMVRQENRALPMGKALWWGVFARRNESGAVQAGVNRGSNDQRERQ
jgi:SAM-dependent methyltransferase